MKTTPDLIIRNAGTLFLFCPLTSRASTWIDEHVQADPTWYGNALVVEHLLDRFAITDRDARHLLGFVFDAVLGTDSAK